jgi:hypothetical protein
LAIQEEDQSLEMWDKVVKIFYSINGYKLSWRAFGIPLMIIGIVSFVFSFLLYYHVWIITAETVIQVGGETVDPEAIKNLSLVNIGSNTDFWFGYILLGFPLALYLLVFWAYTTMLFNARLAEIVRILDDRMISRLFEINKEDIQRIFLESHKNYTHSFQILSFSNLTLPSWGLYSNHEKKIEEKAFKWKSKVMTDLVQKISLRIDGTTWSGYYFVLIVLQVIVAISFVIPALQLGQLHVIHQDIFSPPVNDTGTLDENNPNTYLSLWSIEWAVFGVFVYSFVNLMDRISRRDITPRYYLYTAIRYIFAIALSTLFFLAFQQGQMVIPGNNATIDSEYTLGLLAVISFTIGMFPNTYFRIIISFVENNLRKSFSHDQPLENFFGLDSSEVTRLWEEGVNNIDQLADCSVEDLYRKTRFGPTRLRSIIGRALLWKHVPEIRSQFSKKTENELMNNKEILSKKTSAISPLTSLPVEPIEYEQGNRSNKPSFSDIQTLCSFIYIKPFDDITPGDIASIQSPKRDFEEMGKRTGIYPETLQKIAIQVLYFKDRLEFKETEAGIEDIILDELNLDQS